MRILFVGEDSGMMTEMMLQDDESMAAELNRICDRIGSSYDIDKITAIINESHAEQNDSELFFNLVSNNDRLRTYSESHLSKHERVLVNACVLCIGTLLNYWTNKKGATDDSVSDTPTETS